jgi:Uma2 family endonuclease
MSTRTEATIEDLYKVPENGKAEIVDGELVLMPPTGDLPNRSGGNLYISLRQYETSIKGGRAYTDNIGYIVDLPKRKSFSPDVSFHVGRLSGTKFIDGAPVFAVEIRSENNYGSSAEQKILRKIRDYFAANTLVVWDVDLLSNDVVKVYRSNDPDHPAIYHRGDIAEAEPALPGWRMPVDELFR